MDARTLAWYAARAAEVADRYESVASPLAGWFGRAFAPRSRVLDVGSGSGRDLAALIAAGFDAFGIEPVPALRERALAAHPELSGRLADGGLPQLGQPFGGNFDGIVCSAVLMHLADGDLFDAAFALRDALVPRGRLLVSIPLARCDVGPDARDTGGRLFTAIDPDALQLRLERLGFREIGREDTADALGRDDTSWVTQLFEKADAFGTRPVDQIEGILNRDRKTATYKLALFRALAEVAVQEPRLARFRGNRQVGIPVRRVAEKWLGYFWPLVASERWIPQSSAEGSGSATAKPLVFRESLSRLQGLYAMQGPHAGLSSWALDEAAGRLGPEARARRDDAVARIERAIVQGPVRHAGGSLATGPVFAFDPESREILLHADLWRELSLLGHWIVDAVVLRWARLTERFGLREQLTAADVLPLLLLDPVPEHATRLARECFLRSPLPRCVWTDRPLTETSLVVDHAIPFALWGNNDLWNLLPADAKVNARKSDRLPASSLLRARRPAVVAAWQRLRDRLPGPFDAHATRLLGRAPTDAPDWSAELFDGLRESVEVTALQRGVERWAP